jgi:hypothetical protein
MDAWIFISSAHFTLPPCLPQYRRDLFEGGEHNSSSYSSPVRFKPFAFTQSLLFGLLPLFKSGDSTF